MADRKWFQSRKSGQRGTSPEFFGLLLFLGLLVWYLGQNDGKDAEYYSPEAKEDRSAVLHQAGVEHFRRGMVSKAKTLLDGALRTWERSSTRENLGVINHLIGNHEEAEEHFLRAMELATTPSLYLHTIGLYRDQQKPDKALHMVQRAASEGNMLEREQTLTWEAVFAYQSDLASGACDAVGDWADVVGDPSRVDADTAVMLGSAWARSALVPQVDQLVGDTRALSLAFAVADNMKRMSGTTSGFEAFSRTFVLPDHKELLNQAILANPNSYWSVQNLAGRVAEAGTNQLLNTEPNAFGQTIWNAIQNSTETDFVVRQETNVYRVDDKQLRVKLYVVVTPLDKEVVGFLYKDAEIYSPMLASACQGALTLSSALNSVPSDDVLHSIHPKLLSVVKSVVQEVYSASMTVYPEVHNNQIRVLPKLLALEAVVTKRGAPKVTGLESFPRIQNNCESQDIQDMYANMFRPILKSVFASDNDSICSGKWSMEQFAPLEASFTKFSIGARPTPAAEPAPSKARETSGQADEL